MQLSLNKLPWYGQVGVFVLVSILAVATYHYSYETDARADLAVKQRQLDGLRADIARGRALAARLPEFRSQVKDLETRLESLKAVLPEQKDVADLLRRIQTLATQSNLDIRGFRPQAISQKQLHAEWPITLELDGTYHDLGIFFDKVSKVPRIINISSIAVKAKGAQAQASGHGPTITATCLATTFVLVEPAVATSGTGAAPAAAKR
jgi:type IV pilus assembly protein PilO